MTRRQPQPYHSHSHPWPVKPAVPTRILICGLLAAAAGAACFGGDAPVPQAASSVPQQSSLPPTTTAKVREFTTPPRVSDTAGEGTVMVRFVTYGDADPDDEIPLGMMPDVQIAVIREKADWWTAVGGNDLGIRRNIPPGVRVQSTAEKLAAAPARFVTTGSDGIVEIPIEYTIDSDLYSFCVIFPITDDLIAGCNYPDISLYRSPWEPDEVTIYVYFIHGYAIVEEGPNGSDRYQRFLDGTELSSEPVTVQMIAFSHDDIMTGNEDGEMYLETDSVENVLFMIVNEAHVDSWWEINSNDGANELDVERFRISNEVFEHDWVRVITTGPDGLAETRFSPGNYLICEYVSGCIYEEIIGGRTYELGVAFWDGGNAGEMDMGMLAEEE